MDDYEDREQRHHDARMARLAKEKETLDALEKEVARLTECLHRHRCHPDYLYQVAPTHSELSREWWHDAGWEPNPEYQAAPGDECWRRRRTP